jgi:penicillin-binding protein 2
MYDQRVKVFIGVGLAVLLACVLRLAQMQLLAGSAVQDEIARLKERRTRSTQLKTLRGNILDRRGNDIAADVPRFQVYINYRLSCYLDERVILAKTLAARQENARPSLQDVRDEIDERRRELERVIQECSQFGADRAQIEAAIKAQNDFIWMRRGSVRWARSEYDPNLVAQYGSRASVPFSKAMADLERQFPDPNERIRLIGQVDDIPEVTRDLAIAALETEDDVFAAQVEFREIPDVQVLPTGRRHYPYGVTAAQTIGWVGRATQAQDKELFEDDPLGRYLADEVCGREDGVEYVCETILRGRRGEWVYDIDKQLIRETETRFGRDVQLTLDIELQKRIEECLSDPEKNPHYYNHPMAAAVIEIGTGDILALVSLPSYDLNHARFTWGDLNGDPNQPLRNRAINRNYPPGSVVKPLILVAGLESGTITPETVIHCPSAPQPRDWPNCLIFRLSGVGHDASWTNNARNAIKGSCNIYFSHLADAIEPRTLQEWLFRFGYGRQMPLQCPGPPDPGTVARSFRQFPGEIGSSMVQAYTDIESLDQIPPLKGWERRLFGIGHGNFRVTPLQVANTFATLARGGRHRMPRLFLSPALPASEPVDLPISAATLAVVRDGIRAVVNERGGSAYTQFKDSDLSARGINICGKTGSTERPEHAWFAGFAEDRRGPRIAIAVVIEEGQRGGNDAGPMARAVFELCADAGYLGN